jgi:4-hydroxybenzoate polyprenyltransferase
LSDASEPAATKIDGAGRSDIPAGGWVDRYPPAWARPYLRLARLDRPIGIWLLMFPCWWGTALASPGWPDPRWLLLFALGAALMRGAGCTFNDIVDRDVDARVARTAARPLPAGEVSVRRAALFMVGLALAAFLVLLQFNSVTILLGIASLAVVAVYPFAKRVTHWPQLVLGVAFNWGALLGWTAVTGELAAAPVLLFLAGVLWTLGYDTIYAHQDKEDDILIGVKSTAIRLGDESRRWIVGFYGTAWALLAAAAIAAGLGWWAVLLLVPAGLHLAWQVAVVDFADARSCLAVFKANRWTGILVFAALVAARQIAG